MNLHPGAPGLPPDPVVAGRADPVAEHVRAALDARLRTLLDQELGVRDADPEALHQARVSVRRMRSVLRAAAPFLDEHWADPLRAELGWIGRELGAVRDLDVLLERLRGDLADFDEAHRVAAGPLLSELGREHRAAREELLRALDGQRWAELLEALLEAVREPLPTSDVAPGGPRELRALVAKQYRRLRHAVEVSGAEPTDARLHEIRVLGKRVRYTAELAEPAFGKPMRQLLGAAKRFQDVLGEHHDACVAEQRVLDLLSALGPDPALAFAAGRLVERAHARRTAARERWHDAWRDLRGSAAKV
ncbi:CHAD domain-containing protein [Saccharopolyspora sp. MS10]|uniref:CHAD domain-containing protein n=1 Tax=Saccharopolyspora sp. MS10 TaxID=3385973 RepID=UPI0039A1DE56